MKTTTTLLFALIMLLTGCNNAGKRQTESFHIDTVTLQTDTVMPQKEAVADTGTIPPDMTLRKFSYPSLCLTATAYPQERKSALPF